MERSLERVRLVRSAASASGRVAFDAAAAVLGRVRRRAVAAVQRDRAQVVVGPGRHGQAAVSEAAVRRRVNAAEAEAGHGRGEVEVG